LAYAFVTTVTRSGEDIHVHISETDVGPGDESTITGMPTLGTVLRQTCVVTGGAAVTCDPVLATSAGGTGVDVIVSNDVASGTVDNADPAVPWEGGTGTLYHQSNVDAGLSTVTTVYLLQAGW